MFGEKNSNWDWFVCYTITIGVVGVVAVLMGAGVFDRMILQ